MSSGLNKELREKHSVSLAVIWGVVAFGLGRSTADLETGLTILDAMSIKSGY